MNGANEGCGWLTAVHLHATIMPHVQTELQTFSSGKSQRYWMLYCKRTAQSKARSTCLEVKDKTVWVSTCRASHKERGLVRCGSSTPGD